MAIHRATADGPPAPAWRERPAAVKRAGRSSAPRRVLLYDNTPATGIVIRQREPAVLRNAPKGDASRMNFNDEPSNWKGAAVLLFLAAALAVGIHWLNVPR